MTGVGTLRESATVGGCAAWRRPFLFLLVSVLLLTGGCDRLRGIDEEVALGRAAVEAGDMPRAVIHLKNALQKDPSRADARLLLVDAALGFGDVTTARFELDKATGPGIADAERLPRELAVLEGERNFDALLATVESDRARALPQSGRDRYRAAAFVGLGRAGEAIPVYEALARDPAADPQAIVGLARALEASNRPDDALTLLTERGARAGAAPAVNVALGQAFLRGGRVADAEGAFAAAFAASTDRNAVPTTLQAGLGLAETQLALGRVEAARATLAKLQAFAPEAPATRLMEARLALADDRLTDAANAAARLANQVPGDPRVRLLLAFINVRQGHLQQAEANLNRVLSERSDIVAARQLLGDLQLRQGRADDARRTLAPLATGPVDGPTAVLLGRAAEAAGNHAAANEWFERAVAAGASDQLRFEVATYWIASGEEERAARLLGELAPGTGLEHRRDALLVMANARGTEPDAVRVELDAIADRRPADAALQQFIAQLHAARGDTAAARARLTVVLGTAPKDRDTLLALARIEASARRYEDAEAALRRITADAPKDVVALGALADVAVARGRLDEALRLYGEAVSAEPGSLDLRLRLARTALSAGQVDRARSAIREALAIAPERGDVLAAASFVELQAGNAAEARRLIVAATDASPRVAELWLARAQLEVGADDVDAALASARRAHELRPEWPVAARARAGLELRNGRGEVALEIARSLQARAQQRAAGLELEGDVQRSLRRPAAAESAYARAAQAEPSSDLALKQHLVRREARLADPDAPLRSWLERAPADVPVRVTYAQALDAAGDRAAAIRQYELGLAAAPRQPVFLNNLAWLQFKSGNPRAVESAREAVGAAPDQPLFLDTLGWILVHSGSLEEGIMLLAQAAKAPGATPEIHYHYGYALAKRGDRAGARAQIDKALAADEPFESRADAERLAATL